MATLLSSLRAVNAYPVPQSFIETAAASRGLDLTAEITQDALKSKEYRLAYADLLMWLSQAPSVSQGGQSYAFDNEQRQQFRNEANALYKEFGDDDITAAKLLYGYKGSRL